MEALPNPKFYLAAVRHGCEAPPRWQDAVANAEGVQIHGRSDRMVRFTATSAESVSDLRQQLGNDFLIEEEKLRGPT